MTTSNAARRSSLKPAKRSPVSFLPAQDVFASFDEIERQGIRPTVTILDPWYNKGFGGVVEDYDSFIENLLVRACRVSEHVFLWGFPEIIGPYVRIVPESHELVAWLTWYYKNNPSVIRGWRSSQNACLHIARPRAKLYPEEFLNKVQKERFAEGTLRYVPGPTSVIESSLLIGFVGKKEQTGHPSQKPLTVYDKIIRMTTKEGDLIFDPMCGSGTTGVVALIRNRLAIQCDLNPDYLDMAEARLEQDYDGYAERLDELGNNPDKESKRRKGRDAGPPGFDFD
ncbi:site-specific DNA-methyltransferase [Chthonobacter rhizosphaerae]|uniref:site-specific DNA-methyltransferase n=1 Tax=Chthonobacter rhizosphaerae TaxID=2735553 RepID=UPI0015EFA64F|nr:site-specific DNA-methyltransferase [Chthonobacter rhizosphaerae]